MIMKWSFITKAIVLINLNLVAFVCMRTHMHICTLSVQIVLILDARACLKIVHTPGKLYSHTVLDEYTYIICIPFNEFLYLRVMWRCAETYSIYSRGRKLIKNVYKWRKRRWGKRLCKREMPVY